MQHWNDDCVVATVIKTLGPDPLRHGIYYVAMWPLDGDLKPRKDVLPFDLMMLPEVGVIETLPSTVRDKVQYAVSGWNAVDLFETWFNSLGLGYRKFGSANHQLSILAHGWNEYSGHFIRWLGVDTFDHYFHRDVRDTRIAANYLNDRAAMHLERVPYSKRDLSWLARKENQTEKYLTPLLECQQIAAVYRSMCQVGLF